jgi:5-methylcytosine-specific restriction endonuclease McrA
MPANKNLYPPDWQRIALTVKCQADWRCQCCNVQCYRPGEKVLDHKLVLTVHHKDHIPANSDYSNLIALCAPCHLRADADHHAKNAARTRRAKQTMAGQMELDLCQ